MQVTLFFENGASCLWLGEPKLDRNDLDSFLQGLPQKLHITGLNLEVSKSEIVKILIEETILIDGWREEWDKPKAPPKEPIANCSKCGAKIYHAELFRGPVCPKCGHWC